MPVHEAGREDEVGKYDPLRDHLATRPEAVRELPMDFGEIGSLVGGLPRSAFDLRSWWTNNAKARPQARAWLAAGWRVQAVDLPNSRVVFARKPTVSSTETATSQGSRSGLGNEHAAAGEEASATRHELPTPSADQAATVPKRISWPAIVAAIVAAVAASVTAIVGLTHIPWLALILLAASVGMIAFSVTQALDTRSTPVVASRWWALSTLIVLVACAGAFTYHRWLDAASKSENLPFTAVVKVDPSAVVDQSCRTVVLPFPWHRIPTPAEPLTDSSVNAWEASQHGVDGNETAVLVELQGRSEQVVTFGQPLISVDSRKSPIRGSAAALSGGCGGTLKQQVFDVNLDDPNPIARLETGASFPNMSSRGNTWHQAISPVFTVSVSDPEYFVVIAWTKKSFCQWSLNLPWQSLGKAGVLSIKYGKNLFKTTSAGTTPRHSLIFGSWH